MGQFEPWYILVLGALLSAPLMIAAWKQPVAPLPELVPYEIAEAVQAWLFEILPPQLTTRGGLRLEENGWVIVIHYEDPADLALIPSQRNGVRIVAEQAALQTS